MLEGELTLRHLLPKKSPRNTNASYSAGTYSVIHVFSDSNELVGGWEIPHNSAITKLAKMQNGFVLFCFK